MQLQNIFNFFDINKTESFLKTSRCYYIRNMAYDNFVYYIIIIGRIFFRCYNSLSGFGKYLNLI